MTKIHSTAYFPCFDLINRKTPGFTIKSKKKRKHKQMPILID